MSLSARPPLITTYGKTINIYLLVTFCTDTSIGGNKYGFVIVDDYTRYTWVFFLVDKSDIFATFKSFVKGFHNEFETTIKRVRSDNGSEFKNTRID